MYALLGMPSFHIDPWSYNNAHEFVFLEFFTNCGGGENLFRNQNDVFVRVRGRTTLSFNANHKNALRSRTGVG